MYAYNNTRVLVYIQHHQDWNEGGGKTSSVNAGAGNGRGHRGGRTGEGEGERGRESPTGAGISNGQIPAPVGDTNGRENGGGRYHVEDGTSFQKFFS
jgi:hypothetical protein